MADFRTEEGENIDAEKDAAYRDHCGNQERVGKKEARMRVGSCGRFDKRR